MRLFRGRACLLASLLTLTLLERLLLVDVNALLNLAQQHLLAHTEQSAALLCIDRARDLAGDDSYRPHHIGYGLRLLDRVVVHALEQDSRLELDEVALMLVDILLNLARAVLAAIAVGVVTIGQQQHLDIQPMRQQLVDALHGRADARLVAIEQLRHMLGEAMQQVDVAIGQSRSTRGYHILKPSLMHRYHIGIALDNEALALLRNGTLGLVEAIHRARALVIDDGVGRVEVLGMVILFERASAEGDNLAGHIKDGEHHTPSVEVIAPAMLVILTQAQLEQQFAVVALLRGSVVERLATVRAITQAEVADGGIGEPTVTEVTEPDFLAITCVPQLLFHPSAGPLVDDEHRLALGLCCAFLVGQLAFFYLNVIFCGQIAQRVRIAHLLVLH